METAWGFAGVIFVTALTLGGLDDPKRFQPLGREARQRLTNVVAVLTALAGAFFIAGIVIRVLGWDA